MSPQDALLEVGGKDFLFLSYILSCLFLSDLLSRLILSHLICSFLSLILSLISACLILSDLKGKGRCPRQAPEALGSLRLYDISLFTEKKRNARDLKGMLKEWDPSGPFHTILSQLLHE